MARGETLELEAGTDQEGEAPEELDDGAWELRRGEQSSTAMAKTASGASSAAAVGPTADDDSEVGWGSGI